MAQWLRLHSSKAGDSGSLELRSHMAQGVAKKKKKRKKYKLKALKSVPVETIQNFTWKKKQPSIFKMEG